MSAQVVRRLSCLKCILSSGKFQYHPEITVRQLHHISLVATSFSFTQKNVNETRLHQVRYYAKGKDKKKSNKGRSAKVEINEEVISEVLNYEKMKSEMESALQKMKEEFVQNLSLRSNKAAIETLKMKFEGNNYSLMEVAQITRKNPKLIVVNMPSFPQMVPIAMKAISSSGMNLNPQQDGTTIFVPIPVVTKEHRQNLAKGAKTLFIRCKGNIRDVQTKFVKVVKNKEKEGLAEDVGHDICNQIVFLADSYISQAEKIMISKQTELLEEAL